MVKNLPANAGDPREAALIPGSGRVPGGGNGNTLQSSSLGNSMDRGDWRATVHGITQSDRIERTGRHKHRKLGDEWFAEKTKNGQGTSEGDRLQF